MQLCFSIKVREEMFALRAGILLAVTIIYQYFETYEKEKAQAGGGVLF